MRPMGLSGVKGYIINTFTRRLHYTINFKNSTMVKEIMVWKPVLVSSHYKLNLRWFSFSRKKKLTEFFRRLSPITTFTFRSKMLGPL